MRKHQIERVLVIKTLSPDDVSEGQTEFSTAGPDGEFPFTLRGDATDMLRDVNAGFF